MNEQNLDMYIRAAAVALISWLKVTAGLHPMRIQLELIDQKLKLSVGRARMPFHQAINLSRA